MTFVMRNDGSVSAMKATDLKEVAEHDARIRQLEQLNATLAAEIDRMRPVVEAAYQWHSLSKYRPEHYLDHEQDLANAIVTYEAAKEQG